ncbi:PilZ domain-containing protein [Qipengyuania sp. JC766]|uniref:PilZ domain-containing protein n=1 Tax=Qipengyuania sp. JC766 TaxID=3232139 RepID=UPI00345A9ACB
MQIEQSGPRPEAASKVVVDDRGAPRVTTLYRPAKLISHKAEYLCILRDISASGASLRLLHALPSEKDLSLEFECGLRVAVDLVWTSDDTAGVKFRDPVDVQSALGTLSLFPRRDLRFSLPLPVVLTTPRRSLRGRMGNLSREGAMVRCPAFLAIGRAVRLEARGLPPIDAHVRWRKGNRYGFVFANTFPLDVLAQTIFRLQSDCPFLLAPRADYPDAMRERAS